MWKYLIHTFSQSSHLLVRNVTSPFMKAAIVTPVRTTFILRRKYRVRKHGKNSLPKHFRERDHVYELVEDTNTRKEKNLQLILTEFVANLGSRGTQISVKPRFGYNELLLPGRAVYASPENIQKYCSGMKESDEVIYSSAYVQQTMHVLSRIHLRVWMNSVVPWTIEPWHIRASFRKANMHVPEYAIVMPEKEISGPNLDLDMKLFVIKVTINKNPSETVAVHCRIRHYNLEPSKRSPDDDNYWVDHKEYVFPEQALEYTLPEVTRRPRPT